MIGDADSPTPLSVATVVSVAACRASCNARQIGSINTRCLSALYDHATRSCSLFTKHCDAGSAQPLDDTKEISRVTEARSAYTAKQSAMLAASNSRRRRSGRRRSAVQRTITETTSSGTSSTDKPVTVTSYNRFIVPSNVRGYRAENGYDGTGFHLSIQGVDVNAGRCTFDSNDGTLSSPNYPLAYQAPNSCEFSVYSEGILSVGPGFVLETGASLVVKRRNAQRAWATIQTMSSARPTHHQSCSGLNCANLGETCASGYTCCSANSNGCTDGSCWHANSALGSAGTCTSASSTNPLIVQPGDLIVFDTTSQTSNRNGMWQLIFKMIPQVAKRYGLFKKKALALRSAGDGWIQMPKKEHGHAQVQRSNYNVQTCTDECQHHEFFALTGALNGFGKCYCTDQWSTVVRVGEMNTCSAGNVGSGNECVHVYSTFSGQGDTSAEGDVEIKLLSQGNNPTVVKNLGSCQLEPRPSDPNMCALMACSNMQEVDVTAAVTGNSKLRFEVLARNVRPLCPADNGDLESVHVDIVLNKKTNCRLRQAGAGNPSVRTTTYYDCDED